MKSQDEVLKTAQHYALALIVPEWKSHQPEVYRYVFLIKWQQMCNQHYLPSRLHNRGESLPKSFSQHRCMCYFTLFILFASPPSSLSYAQTYTPRESCCRKKKKRGRDGEINFPFVNLCRI